MIHECHNRGPEYTRQTCVPCGGGVKVKVFRCAIHRLCSIDKAVYQQIPGRYQVCSQCMDWCCSVVDVSRYNTPPEPPARA